MDLHENLIPSLFSEFKPMSFRDFSQLDFPKFFFLLVRINFSIINIILCNMILISKNLASCSKITLINKFLERLSSLID